MQHPVHINYFPDPLEPVCFQFPANLSDNSSQNHVFEMYRDRRINKYMNGHKDKHTEGQV